MAGSVGAYVGGPSAAVPPEPAAGSGTPAAPDERQGWSALPPIERVLAQPARHTVAAPDFAGTLTTWQNPSFTGTLSHAVLDGAPTGLIRNVLTPARVTTPPDGWANPC